MKNSRVIKTYVALSKVYLFVISFFILIPVFSQNQSSETNSDSTPAKEETLQAEESNKTTIYVVEGTSLIGLDQHQQNIEIVYVKPEKKNNSTKKSEKTLLAKKTTKPKKEFPQTIKPSPDIKAVSLISGKPENQILGFDLKKQPLVLPVNYQFKTIAQTSQIKSLSIPESDLKIVFFDQTQIFNKFYDTDFSLRGPPGIYS